MTVTVSPDLDWRRSALCAQVDPEMWVVDTGLTSAAAAHQCISHCPVFVQCDRDRRSTPLERRAYMVIAGVVHDMQGKEWSQQPNDRPCSECRAADNPPVSCRTCGGMFQPPNRNNVAYCSAPCRAKGKNLRTKESNQRVKVRSMTQVWGAA